jgi:hypothetical protein
MGNCSRSQQLSPRHLAYLLHGDAVEIQPNDDRYQMNNQTIKTL